MRIKAKGWYWKKARQKAIELNFQKYQAHTCEICKKSPLYINKAGESFMRDDLLTVDHIIPLSKGGSKHGTTNLQIACFECNLEKGNR